jgi:hypothetical protein
MKICPIAIAVGCAKCPVFSVCPVKRLIGDQPAREDKPAAKAPAPARTVKSTRPVRPTAAVKNGKRARPAAARKKSR